MAWSYYHVSSIYLKAINKAKLTKAMRGKVTGGLDVVGSCLCIFSSETYTKTGDYGSTTVAKEVSLLSDRSKTHGVMCPSVMMTLHWDWREYLYLPSPSAETLPCPFRHVDGLLEKERTTTWVMTPICGQVWQGHKGTAGELMTSMVSCAAHHPQPMAPDYCTERFRLHIQCEQGLLGPDNI